MNDTWGLLHSGHDDAAINMALDEALINWHSEGKIPPVLRFYGWSTATLSVGHFQKVDRTIDLDGVKRHGCQFVRRQTGGSAVLHDDELTYSVVVSESKPYISKSIREAYFELSKGIMEGFNQLGINADYSIPKERFKQDPTAVCFERPSDYEMLVDGKKISGNAQTRKKGVLLQHGSIPFSMDKKVLFDLFLFSDEDTRERKRSAFSQKATTINEASGRVVTYEEAEKAFQAGFEKALNLEFVPFELSEEQWKEVQELAESKYRSDDWNLNFRKRVLAHGKK
ncbi:lipoate--protein ligase family protein [Siminovitchia acidinfaciens]|uniref:Lipoate--protein ligase family protein n=1 Tax=Siminovitchia acidinfaciens TaxID=2321395 RepID=A0A429XZV0_9BACI|nr:lipoate--protein ligase family protein [Siminovitchia acidinfaciens]RST74351.1 lipoate--protein ligase family protein [Siminovitchia acidinfaciens]